jgi:hypothetical protein
MNIAFIRTRWAAVGAAVAISLGAGGIGITHATTSSGERAIYTPINPCRLADVRPAPNTVGPRTAGLGPDETYTLDGWGAVGDCNLPTGTSGLALNVTAVDPTAPTFLRLWPADGTQPTTSNLNPTPGEPPTPNAVNVGLSAAGKFSIFNRFGTVNVIVDVVGVYDDHNHDDRYYTKAETDTAFQRNPVATVSSAAAYSNATTTATPVLSTSITVPDGFNAVLKADFAAESSCGGAGSWCVVTVYVDGTEMAPVAGLNFAFDTDDGGSYEANAITRTLTVGPGTYAVEVRARPVTAGTNVRLDETVLFVEAFLQQI